MTHISTRRTPPTPLHSHLLLALIWMIIACFGIKAGAAEIPVLGTEGNIAKVKRFPAELRELPVTQATLNRISARSAIVLDADRDRIIFAKDPDLPRQPASTIKVLTGMIALKSMTGEESIPVSRQAASMPSSKMYLDPNKEYRAAELITAVLLASSNDASVALAETLAGTEEEFAKIMNLQAEYWGATNTRCKTATGLTAKGQTSTARDLALIFREAMRDPEFAAKVKMRSMQTDEGNTLYNHNKALWQVKGTEGGKTGYTNAARQTYVGQFSRGDNTIIVAVLGSETMWNDIKFLVQYGFGQYRYLPPAEAEPLATDELVTQTDHQQ